jgi:CheY-like chemotaxis protein
MLQGKSIYIIEDNPTNLAIISSILRRNNAIIRYDRWGVDTINRLNHYGVVDLIILDLMFPYGISGYDVFDEIKVIPKFANIPIVAVSAADPQVEMPRARDKGFVGFISKPINHKLFASQVASIIEGKQIWADDDLATYDLIEHGSKGD